LGGTVAASPKERATEISVYFVGRCIPLNAIRIAPAPRRRRRYLPVYSLL
jgi:hypothetical protein